MNDSVGQVPIEDLSMSTVNSGLLEKNIKHIQEYYQGNNAAN